MVWPRSWDVQRFEGTEIGSEHFFHEYTSLVDISTTRRVSRWSWVAKSYRKCNLHLKGRRINKVFWSKIGLDILLRLRHSKKNSTHGTGLWKMHTSNSTHAGHTLRWMAFEKRWLFRRNKKLPGALNIEFIEIFYEMKMKKMLQCFLGSCLIN